MKIQDDTRLSLDRIRVFHIREGGIEKFVDQILLRRLSHQRAHTFEQEVLNEQNTFEGHI